MKKIIYIILIAIVLSCSNRSNSVQIEYKKKINFGEISQNDTVNKIIYIKNISENDLIIKKVKASCGCTLVKLKDSVISENKNAEITVQYIPNKNDNGDISKSIVVEANTNPNFTVLYLVGKIKD